MSVTKNNNPIKNNKKQNITNKYKNLNDYLSDELNVNNDIFKDLSKEFEFMCLKNNTEANTNNIDTKKQNINTKKQNINAKKQNININVDISVNDDEIMKLSSIINTIIELKKKK